MPSLKSYVCHECGASFDRLVGFRMGRPPMTCSEPCKAERLARKYREAARRDYAKYQEARQRAARERAAAYRLDVEWRTRKRVADRLYYRANSERIRATVLSYGKRKQSERDPEYLASRYASTLRRRARRAAVETRRVVAADIRALFNRQRGECFYCGTKTKLTVDHVIPIVRGGRHAIGNLVGACMPCNAAKRDRFAAEFRLAGVA